MASLFFALKQWRNIRKEGGSIPGFKPPGGHEQGYSSATAFDDGDPAFDPPEDDEVYDRRPAMAYAASRPSGTFISGDRAPFGALAPGLPSRSEPRTDDPLPTGYAPASQRQSNPFADTHAPSTPPAYVDPYERIRANYQLDESSPPRLAPLPYAGGGLSDPIR